MRRPIVVFLVGMIAGMGGQTAEAVISGETFERTARAVAQVRARQCPGGEVAKAGSGFLFSRGDRLVTALHVVAGCDRIDAYFERAGGHTVGAEVERVLEESDLALLRLDRRVGQPLLAIEAQPRPNDELDAIAFFLGTPSIDNKTLKVTFGSTQLRSMLPARVSRELAQSGTIDLNLEVVRLDGHLLPGASGAPLITADGRVAAVGSGGLRSGAASISWAVPASHLNALLASQEQPRAQIGRRLSGLFSTPYAERTPEQIRCGGIGFVPIVTRSFLELSVSTDDPRGLNQLLASAALPRRFLEQFDYRIYTPVDAGAAIAIPSWMRVERRGSVCVASSPDGRLLIEFGGSRVADPLMVQINALEFENRFLARHQRNWIPDLNYSYLAPLSRFDGLTVNRKAVFTSDGFAPPAWAFETLMVKGDTFAAAIAVNLDHDPQRVRFCQTQPYASGCDNIHHDMAAFAQAVIGVHLSTFPIY
jgi:S1-C subfamily serine protease